MMSVLEYANDVNLEASVILDKCRELNLKAKNEDDLLSEEDIIMLDNNLETDEEIEEAYEEKVLKPKKSKKKKPSQDKNILAKKKKAMYKNKEKLQSNDISQNDNIIVYKDGMTIKDLAEELNVKASELITKLFSLGLLTTINTKVSFENAEILLSDYGKELKKAEEANVSDFENYEVIDDEKDLVPRPPVVTIMGHVDHGKTTLLDTIRKTNVASGEAGGITQAISAYQVKYNDRLITFIDTPGHAAFTEMRARGANVTDIVIIIVAADDGVMPQTKEAIDHAKAAGVPIMVAINKIDKVGADPDKVMLELSKYGLMPEEWGGDTIYTKISALNNIGIDKLLENILLIADIEDLKANPNRYALGTVLESKLNKHVGASVTLLVQNGTLRLGDPVVVGTCFGRVRTLKNDLGLEITEAGPSMPVEITGLSEVPAAGDRFMAFESEKEAKQIASERKLKEKEKNLKNNSVNLDDLFAKINEGLKELNVIVKADVNGSAEAVKNSLLKISVDGVKVNVIRASVGGITESDIVLAKASNALIIGFNIRPNNKIKQKAHDEGVDIRLYDIIYKLSEDIEKAMKGMLEPEYEEKVTGEATIKQLFKYSKVGNIAGCIVNDGVIKNGSKARVIRNDVTVYDGTIGSLQRGKDQTNSVKKGLECGLTIDSFNDIKVGDTIETYELVEVER